MGEEEEGKKKKSTMRVVDQRLRGSRAVGGWVAVEERYFNRIFTPIIFRSRKFFSTLDVFSPLEFSSPAGARSKNHRDRGAFKKAASSAARREDEEEEGRIEKVLVSEATQRD